MMDFHDAHPGIEIRLVTGNTDTIAQAVIEGRVELGFVEGALSSPLLLVTTVAEDELIAVVGPLHPWADGRERGTADVAEAIWIMREPGSGTRSSFEAFLQGQGIDPARLSIALELPSNEAVLSAVEGGSAVAALSIAAAGPALAAGRVVRVALPLTWRALSLVRHRERHATAAVRAFEALVLAGGAAGPVSRPAPPPPRSRPGIPAA